MRANGGVNLLKLLFTFPVHFELFSELAAKQATSGADTLFLVKAEKVKKERVYVSFARSFLSDLFLCRSTSSIRSE